MPFDGSGNFSRLYNWQQDRDDGIQILASRMDGEFNNFATGMNLVFFRNGLVPMSGNLSMGQNYIIGLGAGSVGALGLRFSDDANTGLFLNGIGKLGLVAGGTMRAEANSAGLAVTGALSTTGNAGVGGSITAINGTFTGNGVFDGTVNSPSHILSGIPNAGMVVGGSGGNNLVIVGDSADYYVYERSTDIHKFVTNNITQAHIDVGGYVNAATGFRAAGNTVWHAGNFTPGNYALLSGASFFGAVSSPSYGVVGVPNAGIQASGGNLLVYGDLNDYYQYDRTNNSHNFVIGSGLQTFISGDGFVNATAGFKANGSVVWHAGNLTPGDYARLSGATFSGGIYAPTVSSPGYSVTGIANAGLVASGGNMLLVGDLNDYYQYDRTGNSHNFAVAGSLVFYVTASEVNAQVALKQNGQQVWHAGNLTPGDYARLSGATFSGGIYAPTVASPGYSVTGIANAGLVASGGNMLLIGDLNDYYAYDRIANSHNFVVGSSTRFYVTASEVNAQVALKQNGQQVWHAGNLTPGDYAPLSGAVFNGNVGVTGFTYPGNDAAFYLAKSGGNPIIVFDTGDYYGYNRTSNSHDFVVGGVGRASITGSGINVTGTGAFTGDVSANSKTLGTREIVNTTISTAYYNFGLGDLGGMVIANGGTTGVGILNDSTVSWPIGSTFVLINNAGGNISVNLDTGVALTWAGTGSTGARTLAASAVVTFIKWTANGWFISGAGIS